MPPSSKTWSRRDGLASKRKRPSAHDFFDDSKKRARPEADRAVSRDGSPKTPRDQGSVVREKVGIVSFTPYPDSQDIQDSRQHSPLVVASNECHHDNQIKPFTTGDFPLSPLSHSPEHIPDSSREPTKRASRQTLCGSFSTGNATGSSRVSTSEPEREYSTAPSTVIAAKSNTPVSRNTPQATFQSTHQMAIVESLADFAKMMTSASTLEVKHDLLKQQAATEEQKRRRLQKCKSGFDFIDDDDDYRVEAVTKSAARLEQQIELHQQKQLETTSSLAAKLQQDQDVPLGSGKHETPDSVNVINEELIKLRRELDYAGAEISDLKQTSLVQDDLNKHLDTLVTRDDVQYHVRSTEQRVTQIVADFQKDCQVNRDMNNQHTQRLDGLDVRLEETERNVLGLAEKIRDQQTTIGLLETLVKENRTGEDPGLKSHITLESAKLSATQARVQKNESEIQQLGDRISQMQLPQSSDHDSTWSKDLEVLRNEINYSHNSHVEQQKAEFDFLASDLERLDDHTKKQAKQIEDLERSQAGKNENLKRNLDHLSNRTTAVETMSVAQQQKFDGLTTDHLFTSIINHLHGMYPNLPVNIAARVSEIVSRLQAVENFLGGITQRFNQTDYRLNQAEQRHTALQNHSVETTNVLNGLQPELARLKDVALDKEMRDRVDKLGETTEALEKRLENLINEASAEFEKCSTNVAALRSDIAVSKEQPQIARATMEDSQTRTSTAQDEFS